jgi:hypothetical protein
MKNNCWIQSIQEETTLKLALGFYSRLHLLLVSDDLRGKFRRFADISAAKRKKTCGEKRIREDAQFSIDV